MSPQPEELTQLLRNWSQGDRSALERLIPFVYDELRRIARRSLNRERMDHTLQTTALVHEAYVRLAGQNGARWQNRSQFFAIAASLVRRILVDHARTNQAAKRGGGGHKVYLEESRILSPQQSPDVLALNDALDELEKLDPRKSRVVEMRFFAGLNTEEIAEILQISTVTVLRDWSMARAWLFRTLHGDVPA